MHIKVFLVVLVLAVLQLGSAQECGVVVAEEDKLREEINKTVTTALEAEREYYKEMNKVVCALLEANKRKCKKEINKAVENITDILQQLLDPLLSDLARHLLPGTTSGHPATSCEEVQNSNPNSLTGYYWIQTATHPLVQQYCNFDQLGLYTAQSS